jgi:7,8-dihydroneopterin aldolase/epimerase/oxygenase
MGVIALEGMEFFAYHGFYDEEQKIGNRYAIDLAIKADISLAAETDVLKKTINYETLYKIVAEVMHQKHRLLEHVGHAIIHKVRTQFVDIESVKVSVTKFNPPIGGVCERARVTLEE